MHFPITQINTNIENKYLVDEKKIQKTCWGCLLKSQKNPLAKIINFYKRDITSKDPPNSQKDGSKSEKYKITNIFTRFFQRRQFLLKGF